MHDLALVWFYEQNVKEALPYTQKALFMFEKMKEKNASELRSITEKEDITTRIADCYYRLGILCKRASEKVKYFEMALQRVQLHPWMTTDSKVAELHHLLALCQYELKLYDKAEENFVKSLHMHKDLQRYDYLAEASSFLGHLRRKEKRTDEAELYFIKAREYLEKATEESPNYFFSNWDPTAPPSSKSASLDSSRVASTKNTWTKQQLQQAQIHVQEYSEKQVENSHNSLTGSNDIRDRFNQEQEEDILDQEAAKTLPADLQFQGTSTLPTPATPRFEENQRQRRRSFSQPQLYPKLNVE